jgi:hypothetical protein
MHRRRLAQLSIVWVGVWVGVLVGLTALGAGGVRVYRNDAMRVRAFSPPAGWELAPQSSYPRLLAYYAHAEGGRITLSAERVPPSTPASSLAQRARAPLEKQGYAHLQITNAGDRTRLEGDLDGGRRLLKQVYLVESGIGYVVTLISPTSAAPHMTADFEEALRSLQLGSESSSEPPR